MNLSCRNIQRGWYVIAGARKPGTLSECKFFHTTTTVVRTFQSTFVVAQWDSSSHFIHVVSVSYCPTWLNCMAPGHDQYPPQCAQWRAFTSRVFSFCWRGFGWIVSKPFVTFSKTQTMRHQHHNYPTYAATIDDDDGFNVHFNKLRQTFDPIVVLQGLKNVISKFPLMISNWRCKES